jgi:GDP-4-dehydro-6-deoxy-D-mannose reductase
MLGYNVSMKVMVTGVNGFVGKHLARELHKSGARVVGVSREATPHPEIKSILSSYYICDLTDQKAVDGLPLQDIASIINLAGLAQVGASWGNPELYQQVNSGVLTTLCLAVLEQRLTTRIIAVSTGAVYDSVQDMPLTESSHLISSGSPYALSKILMEQEATKFRKLGVDCFVVRPFNHFGPGQEPGFLLPDLYQKLKQAEQLGEPIKVGNLETRRDYTDVRDVVRAYSLLALAKEDSLFSHVYNICSGTTKSGQQILDALKGQLQGVDKISVVIDQALIRPSDPAELVGSAELIQRDTGWKPEISFEQTIADFVRSKSAS